MFKAGLSVIQSTHTTTSVLHERMLSEYQGLVTEYNPFTDEEIGEVLGQYPRESMWDQIKSLLLQTSTKGNLTGKNLYNLFKVTKSEITSQWIPPLGISHSGDNLDDRYRRVHAHVWAYRKNETIKKHNRTNSHDVSKQKPFVTPEDCPEDHYDVSMYSEMPLFKIFHDHPLLNVSQMLCDFLF